MPRGERSKTLDFCVESGPRAVRVWFASATCGVTGNDALALPCSHRGMTTIWDVYREVRGSSHARTPSELGVIMNTDGDATIRALEALDRAWLVYAAVIGGVAVTYRVGRGAVTDEEARALAFRHGLDLEQTVAVRLITPPPR